MARKIQAWVEFGPRLEPREPLDAEGLILRIVQATNQSRGSVKAILDELDSQLEIALQEGTIVQLPNGMHFQPIGKRNGKIEIRVRINPDLLKRINAIFRGKWRNPENIGKTEDEIFDQWDAAHPGDPVDRSSL